jgi:hypothetical protein
MGAMLVVAVLSLLLFMVYRSISCAGASDSANLLAGDFSAAVSTVYSGPAGVDVVYKLPDRVANQAYNASIVNRGILVYVRTRCGFSHGGSYLNSSIGPYPVPLKNFEENVTLVLRKENDSVVIWKRDACAECIRVTVFYGGVGGDDCDHPNNEYVFFQNKCGSDCDLTGMSVEDSIGHKYVFGSYVLHSEMSLYSGEGVDSATELYWRNHLGPCPAVWDNEQDTLYLRDSRGYLLKKQTYTVRG